MTACSKQRWIFSNLKLLGHAIGKIGLESECKTNKKEFVSINFSRKKILSLNANKKLTRENNEC